MAEAPTEQPEAPKVPVAQLGGGWRCPDCGVKLVGDMVEEGYRCEACGIGWTVAFMVELTLSQGRPNADIMKQIGAPTVAMPDGESVAVTDGAEVIVLQTGPALQLAAVIHAMAAQGDIVLPEN